MGKENIFLSASRVMQTSIIMQSHELLLEMQEEPSTKESEIEKLKTELRTAVIDYLCKFIVTRDMVEFCKIYITGDDLLYFKQNLYNYNKFKLIFKK